MNDHAMEKKSGAPRVASRSGSECPPQASDPPTASGDHERALTLLLVLLLDGMVRGAFAGILVSFCLALEAFEDRSDCLLARGMAGGNVEELLSGLRALMS